MSSDRNHWSGTGRMTRDPEVKYVGSGKMAVATTSIAVHRYVKDQDDAVSFLEIVAWGKTAESLVKHFTKGRPISLEGSLQQDRWKDKDTGKEREKVRIVVDRWWFCDSPKSGTATADKTPEFVPPDEDTPF